MLRATTLALLLASPAAAVTVPFHAELEPVVPHVFSSGETLVTAYHPDPNFYNGDKAKAPPAAPPVVFGPPDYVRWACYWRTAAHFGSDARALQGCPDPVPLARVATAKEPRWYIPESGGTTVRITYRPPPSGPGPAPIPLPATAWFLLAALAGLWGAGRQSRKGAM